jgi:diguanylate cyclase (GGDEF)-like protein
MLGFGASLVFTVSQPKVYESSTTLVLTPSGNLPDEFLNAVSALARQPEIAETYAQIANSQTMRSQAVDRLNLNAVQRGDVTLTSRLIPGTTVLQLTARSTDPELARHYADAIRELLIDFSPQLGEAFELRTLDAANVTNTPVAPNVPLNVGVGFLASLMLGIGAALASEILAPSARGAANIQMLDHESLAYSQPFYMLRLTQEMSRARRSRSALVVALVNVAHGSVFESITPRQRRQALRNMARLLESHLRPEDTIARLDDGLFAVLLPDTGEGDAISMIDSIRRRVAEPAFGQVGGEAIHAQPAAGVASYAGESINAEELLERARSALKDAETVPVGKTQAFSTLRPA